MSGLIKRKLRSKPCQPANAPGNQRVKTINTPVILLCLALLPPAFGSAAQSNTWLVQFGEPHTLDSKILHEQRPYWVHLPASHPTNASRAAQKYPGLYLLDGEWNFEWVGEVARFMSESSQIPELIVAGIPNTNREHDLTPTPDPGEVSSGGGELFERFRRSQFEPAGWDIRRPAIPLCRLQTR